MSQFPPDTEPADARIATGKIRYSVCTIVTRPKEYSEMVASFRAKGFTAEDCEFLYLDNSEANRFDAFAGYNVFLTASKGENVILCHQDVLLLRDGRAELDAALA